MWLHVNLLSNVIERFESVKKEFYADDTYFAPYNAFRLSQSFVFIVPYELHKQIFAEYYFMFEYNWAKYSFIKAIHFLYRRCYLKRAIYLIDRLFVAWFFDWILNIYEQPLGV